MVPSPTPIRLPLPPKWGLKCTAQDQLRDASCDLANVTEDINKISVVCISYVVFCQITLAHITNRCYMKCGDYPI